MSSLAAVLGDIVVSGNLVDEAFRSRLRNTIDEILGVPVCSVPPQATDSNRASSPDEDAEDFARASNIVKNMQSRASGRTPVESSVAFVGVGGQKLDVVAKSDREGSVYSRAQPETIEKEISVGIERKYGSLENGWRRVFLQNNNSGEAVHVNEFMQSFDALQLGLSATQIRELTAACDQDAVGYVTEDAFMRVFGGATVQAKPPAAPVCSRCHEAMSKSDSVLTEVRDAGLSANSPFGPSDERQGSVHAESTTLRSAAGSVSRHSSAGSRAVDDNKSDDKSATAASVRSARSSARGSRPASASNKLGADVDGEDEEVVVKDDEAQEDANEEDEDDEFVVVDDADNEEEQGDEWAKAGENTPGTPGASLPRRGGSMSSSRPQSAVSRPQSGASRPQSARPTPMKPPVAGVDVAVDCNIRYKGTDACTTTQDDVHLEKTLLHAFNSIVTNKDLNTLTDLLMNALCTISNADGWGVFYVTAQQLQLVCADKAYLAEVRVGKVFTRGAGITDSVAEMEQPLCNNDVEDNPQHGPIDRNCRGLVANRMVNLSGQVIGVVQLVRTNKYKYGFKPAIVELMVGVTNILSTAYASLLAHARILKQNTTVDALLRASGVLSHTSTVTSALVHLTKLLTNACQADRCSVWLLDTVTDRLVTQIAEGLAGEEIYMDKGQGLVGTCMLRQAAINVEDCYSDKRFNRKVDESTGYTTSTMLCVPIFGNASYSDSEAPPIGVIQVINKLSVSKISRIQPLFDNEDLRLVEAMASLIGASIERASHHLTHEHGGECDGGMSSLSPWELARATTQKDVCSGKELSKAVALVPSDVAGAKVSIKDEDLPLADPPEPLGPAYRTMLREKNPHPLCKAVVEPISRRVGAAGWGVFLCREKGWELVAADNAYWKQNGEQPRLFPRAAGLLERAVFQDRAFVIKNARAHEAYDSTLDRNCDSIVLSRLISLDGRLIGALHLLKYGADVFHRDDNYAVDEAACELSVSFSALELNVDLAKWRGVAESLVEAAGVVVNSSAALRLTLKDFGAVIRKALDADRCTIWLVDLENDKLVAKAVDGLNELSMNKTTGLVGAALSQMMPLNIEDCYTDPRFRQAVDKKTGYMTKTMLCLPFKDVRGGAVGVIQVINKRIGVFDATDIHLLSGIAQQIASALELGVVPDREHFPSLAHMLSLSGLLKREVAASPGTRPATAETPPSTTSQDGSTLHFPPPHTGEAPATPPVSSAGTPRQQQRPAAAPPPARRPAGGTPR